MKTQAFIIKDGKSSSNHRISIFGRITAALATGGLILIASILSSGNASAGGPARPLILTNQGYGVVEDMNIDAQLSAGAANPLVGHGPLADVAPSAKAESKHYTQPARPPVPRKVENQGFGSIHDMTFSMKAESKGFGAIDDRAKSTEATH